MQSHFALFNLPETYALDRARLDAAYRELQNTVHPDRFAAQPETEQRVAMQWATQANEAYQTLKHPVDRGVYLLKLHGIDALDATDTRMAPAFLMQQMEWREALDDADDAGALQSLAGEVEQARRDALQQVTSAIDEQQDMPAAAALVRRMMFIQKFAQEVRQRQLQQQLQQG